MGTELCQIWAGIGPIIALLKFKDSSVQIAYDAPIQRENIIRKLSELLRAGLCDTMFTVSSTLMWAVLTGPADWVCHIGTLTPCIAAVA